MNALRSLQIGDVRTRTNLVLSPMSGVTDCAFRRFVLSCSGDAVGLVVTEFIAAEGLTRDNAKSLAMMRFDESERPISIQIFGSDVERMVRAACMAEDAGADIVDINCGCPAPKVVKRGGGAELMRQLPRLRAILKGVRAKVRIPMTVKIRSGWDVGCLNALEVARLAQDEGAAMLAIHGRSRVQLYSGAADWELVARVRGALAIPVIGSGDVTTPDLALARLAAGCCDGVMVGRAAMENPWIFAQIADLFAGRAPRRPSPPVRVAALERFRDGLRESLPDHAFIGRFRGMACRLVKGMAGGAAARRALGAATSVDDVTAIFSEFVLGESRGIDLAGAVPGDAGVQAGAASPRAHVPEPAAALAPACG
jgi:tRNA-dihydrouridine synthase B